MITAALLIALAGLAAGAVHVLTGPDHLAALLPLAVDSPSRSARTGAAWGAGHGLAVIVLAGLFHAFGGALDIEATSAWSEIIVGVLLVGLGIWTLRRSRLLVVHTHGHDHDADAHDHVHVHIGDRTVGEAAHAVAGRHDRHVHGAFGFGVLHGSAGAGHLLGVLPAVAMTPADAVIYVLAYAGSAIAAMALFALGAGKLVRHPRHVPLMLQGAGALSLVVGLIWIGTSV